MLAPSINDRINEILDDPIAVALNGQPYVEALRGVLREHRPVEAQQHSGDRRLCCKTCHQHGTTPVWPCPTIAVTATAFGIEGDPR